MADITLILIVAATALNGIAVEASLDQAIKQLPTRHRIGVAAYSTYSKAADLGNGIPWYVSVGIGAVVLTVGAASRMVTATHSRTCCAHLRGCCAVYPSLAGHQPGCTHDV